MLIKQFLIHCQKNPGSADTFDAFWIFYR